jgi:hypothetical protein
MHGETVEKKSQAGFALLPGNNYIIPCELTFSQKFYHLLRTLNQQVDQAIIYARTRILPGIS